VPQQTRNPRNPENKPGDARDGDKSLQNRQCTEDAHNAALDRKNNQPFLAGNAEFPEETRHPWAKKLIIFRDAQNGVDSKLIDYTEMSRVNQRGIYFVTIRRRGSAILRSLEQRPTSDWKKAVIDTPKRCHQQIRYLEEKVRLRGYDGLIRQMAVSGLGRDRPTLFISNHMDETPRELIIRYAGRNRIEDGLDIGVNFFHLDCLASEVRLNVDLDATLTVIANGCYR
jgi:hypothetical protein